jgi:hypothetical protein
VPCECRRDLGLLALGESRSEYRRLLAPEREGHSSWKENPSVRFSTRLKRWNEDCVVLPPRSKPKTGDEFKITMFPKHVGHLIRHCKAWRVNQKKRVAIEVGASSDVVRALQHNTGVRVPRDFEAQVIPVEPQQSEPVMQIEREANESKIPPPTMHLAPLPCFQVHQALQAPLLAWGAPPFHPHTAGQTKKRARKVCSRAQTATIRTATHRTMESSAQVQASWTNCTLD